MRITKQGIDYVVDCGFDYKLLRSVKNALKVKLPPTQYNPRFGSHKDGFLRLYTEQSAASAQIKIKRGHLPYITRFIENRKIDCQIDYGEEKSRNFASLQFSKWLQADERDYQRDAIRAWLEQGYGIIKVPTRGGKTVIASEVIRQLTEHVSSDIKILFLTDLTDLYNQTVAELEKFLLEEVGEIKENIFNPKRITVAMTQTLQSKLKQEASKSTRHQPVRNFLKDLKDGAVFVDECHDFTSQKRLDILRITKCEMICGLSGTPEKSSNIVDNYRMKGIIGDVIYHITESDLEERKILAKSRVLLCLNKIFCDELEIDYNTFIEEYVFNNEKRNFILACMAQICAELGLKVLMMTRSKKHGQILADAFGFDYISGDDDPTERKRVKNKIINEEGGCVAIVTEIWKKGITLPQAQVLINFTVGREESNVIQKRGRILGATEGKDKALTIDMVDFSEFYLSSHSYDRINSYEKFTGAQNIDIIDSEPEADFVQRFYDYVNDWFYG